MAHILLTHPYVLAEDPREDALHRPHPPLAPLIAAAALQAAGHKVRFFDPTLDRDVEGLRAAIAADPPDRVAILADDLSIAVKQCTGAVRAATLAQIAACAGIPTLVGGPDVSDHPGLFLQAGAHAAVVGDPTEALLEWAAGTRDVVGLHGDPGAGGRRPNLRELDRLPAPAWGLVDMGAYARRWRRHHGLWEVPVSTARGCPYRCNWCAKPTWGRSYQVRSPDAVVAELGELRAAWKPDRVWMADDIFGLRKDWLAAFARQVGGLPGGPMPFRCQSRADLLRDAAYVADLAAAGCVELWMGAESGDDRILRAMDKDSSVAEIRRARRLAGEAGIVVGLFLQLGYPGEDAAALRATIDLVGELRPDRIGVSVTYPLPGTGLSAHVAAARTGERWEASMENRTLYEAPFGPDFYEQAKRLVQSTWRGARLGSSLRALRAEPGAANAKQAFGDLLHAARRPLLARQVWAAARPNPKAVPLTWGG